MKATELRIENLITLKSLPNEYQRVMSLNNTEWLDGVKRLWIETDLCEGELFDEFEAIPLTEEWLLKFGFVEERTPPLAEHGKFYSKFNYDCKYSLSYAKFRGDWGFYHSYTDAIKESENNKFDFISCGIKYVHQLQNLFFAITGEELKY